MSDRALRGLLLVAFALVAVALVNTAFAQVGKGETLLTWEPADTYDDGSFMVLGEQRIYAARTLGSTCGTPPADESFTLFQVVSAGIASFGATGQWNGLWYYYATSVDVFGTESVVHSNVACKGISISGNWQPPGAGVRPNPPRNLRAE